MFFRRDCHRYPAGGSEEGSPGQNRWIDWPFQTSFVERKRTETAAAASRASSSLVGLYIDICTGTNSSDPRARKHLKTNTTRIYKPWTTSIMFIDRDSIQRVQRAGEIQNGRGSLAEEHFVS
mmetsp:Transcript_19824/g.56030  ORF Transcript_19824/g.56030 Transcript_19824/m.56030 type:complete len:122 (-) Transcript_19824:353-718(-)